MPDQLNVRSEDYIRVLQLLNHRQVHFEGLPPYNPEEAIIDFKEIGLKAETFSVDKSGYEKYMTDSDYPGDYFGGKPEPNNSFMEKTVEHYISLKLLDFRPGDAFMDIASDASPFPWIIEKKYGIPVYAQDLKYQPGVHGKLIGGSASSIPLPDGSITKMTLHCSLEHFEGDYDMKLFPELIRLLKAGGEICLIPFYISKVYATLFDPINILYDNNNLAYDEQAELYGHFNWNRHCRFYNAAKFKERVFDRIKNDAEVKFVYVDNLSDIGPNLYCSYALLIKKK